MPDLRKNMLVMGFALFSMFFGAGNVIFPPYLGLSCGGAWFTGFAWYYLADIGLALLTLFAMLRAGSTEAVLHPLGSLSSKILMSAIVLCIGPLLAIPRTAATTYELALSPLVSGVSPVLFSVLFFALTALICLRQSAVVDIVGKILTPALLIGLLILIAVGIAYPIGPIPETAAVECVARTGIEAGYQTMDVLAAAVFGVLILKSAEGKGYTDPRSRRAVISGAALIAGLALLGVYLGLTYLGATTAPFFDLSVHRADLMTFIVRSLLGRSGVWLFALIVTLACLTTATALVSAAAHHFSSLLHCSYRWMAAAICALSAFTANFGLETIVSLASPILSLVYPPTLTAVISCFLPPRLSAGYSVRFAALAAFLTSAAQMAGFLAFLPFTGLGFGWLLPTILGGITGLLTTKTKK
ncbi:MAG: branched-chain amino acid transport system II carrier protein [Oscillibacter sp.]|nr:branched-chain amino acid transport system II carrier protein [Oscillibacter sp.]